MLMANRRPWGLRAGGGDGEERESQSSRSRSEPERSEQPATTEQG
jgi:hypothetical protein